MNKSSIPWNKLVLFAPFLVFGGLILIFFVSMGKEKGSGGSFDLPSTRIGQPIPSFRLPNLYQPNQRLTQADLTGPFLLNVWGSWCPGCLLEHDLLVYLSRQGIKLVGLNYKDTLENAYVYLKTHQDPYTQNIFDKAGSLGLDLGVYGAPETYVVDAQGIIRYRHVGVLTQAVWQANIQPIWSELAHAYAH